MIEDELVGTDYFVVSVKSNESESNIQYYIDGMHGVGIGICAKLSRKISNALDEMDLETDGFRFEISSPGADKSLSDIRQYYQHIGRELEVSLRDGSLIEGELLEVSSDFIVVNRLLDKKKKLIQKQNIELQDIDSSKVKISFKSVRK